MGARLALALAAALLAATPAAADPMKCSNEQHACIAVCQKIGLNRQTLGTCIGNCNRRQGACRQTGCWDNGTNIYCGLLRQ
jgi:hypothetical protein